MQDEKYCFILFLQNNGIEMTELTFSEEEAYRQIWFEKMVPPDKRQKAIDCYCFNKDGYTGYLWHVFSYKVLNCIEGTAARTAFDRVFKQNGILLANWGEIASCELKKMKKITAESLDFLADVILTDEHFEWTYVKTHEADCGPYFFELIQLTKGD